MSAPLNADLRPAALAPYFLLAALVHAGAVASRFDVLAAKLPTGAALGIMLAQFPLLLLSGYFEGRLDYGPSMAGTPRWMQIKSTPVKLAFTFAFIYLVVVAAQTWDVNIGPLDPTPPLAFPLQQRVMWFAMFTAGMVFPFYLAATGILVPVLRALTAPLRMVPAVVGAVIALAAGAGLGVLVMAGVQSTKVGAFVRQIKATLESSPAMVVGVTLAMVLVPLLVGLVAKRD